MVRVDWGRGMAVLTGAVLATLLGVGSAAAHVEIKVEPAQAGARDAVVTFTAAAESLAAGISALEVQVPEGINPADVTLTTAPQDWTLLETTDGYIVSGPPLPVGMEARYAIKVKQLPNAASMAFKTLQSYTDGTVARWVELPAPGGAIPASPAPIAHLGSADGAVGAPPPPPAPGHTHPAPAQAQPAQDNGVPVMVWVVLAVLAATVIAGAVFLVVRRRS